jgi:hypothetical protein
VALPKWLALAKLCDTKLMLLMPQETQLPPSEKVSLLDLLALSVLLYSELSLLEYKVKM